MTRPLSVGSFMPQCPSQSTSHPSPYGDSFRTGVEGRWLKFRLAVVGARRSASVDNAKSRRESLNLTSQSTSSSMINAEVKFLSTTLQKVRSETTGDPHIWQGPLEHPLADGADMSAPTSDTAEIQTFVMAGRKRLGRNALTVNAINEFDTDTRARGSKNQAITMVGPLGEIDGEDLFKLNDIVSQG